MKRRTFLAGAPMAMAVSPVGAVEQPASIALGSVSLSFYAVTGGIVAAVLERLGQRVKLVKGVHEQIFPLLGNGGIDLLAAAWLPEGHAAYWERYGREATELATLYDGARFFWGVPPYVPESEVASIADLARPEVAAKMAHAIQGIGAGAAISTLSIKAIEVYGLAARGFTFQPGTQAQWIDAYRAAVAARRWFVFPTWAPQFLNRDGALRALHDPRGVLGNTNRAVLVAPRTSVAAFPPRVRDVLARIRLDLAAVTQMDWDVNMRNLPPREAALAWMAANAPRVNAWFGSG